jgi:hypothetical protein
MIIDDYRKNLRGVNEGVDFSPEFLVSFRPMSYNDCSLACDFSNTSSTRFARRKLSCLKSTLARSALSMHGESFLPALGKLVRYSTF